MAPRSRPSSKRPLWFIVLVAFVCAVAIGAYLYTPRHYTACYLVPSEACNSRPPPEPARVYTDDEIAARAIMRDIIRARPVQSKNPKIAFMFLTPSSLPFEKLWEKFFMVWFLQYLRIASRSKIDSMIVFHHVALIFSPIRKVNCKQTLFDILSHIRTKIYPLLLAHLSVYAYQI
jgi:hypothetical protein